MTDIINKIENYLNEKMESPEEIAMQYGEEIGGLYKRSKGSMVDAIWDYMTGLGSRHRKGVESAGDEDLKKVANKIKKNFGK